MAERNKLLPDAPQGSAFGQLLPYEIKVGADGNRLPGTPIQLAVPQQARDAINNLQTLVTAPGDALAGKLSDADIMRAGPASASALMNLPGGAPAGSLRMFGGVGSALAHHLEPAFASAKRMYANGASHAEIWNLTGMFKDVDGHWKFEIPDRGASFLPQDEMPKGVKGGPTGDIGFPFEGSVKLGDVLSHPTLYEHYPHLKELPVTSTGYNFNYKGGYSEKNPGIQLADGPEGDVLSTLLHEIQHGIQHYEDFGRGGTLNNFLPEGFNDKYTSALNDVHDLTSRVREHGANSLMVRNAQSKIAAGEPPSEVDAAELGKLVATPGLAGQYQAALEKLKPLVEQRGAAYKDYQRLAGEIESKNVQERHATGAYDVYPLHTEGYPSGKQLLRTNRLTNMIEVDKPR